MLPVAAALLAWGVTGAAAARPAAPEPATAPPTAMPAVPAASGPAVVTTLDFPLPRALPCRRFETVEIEVGEDAASVSGREGTTLSWSSGGRAWSISASNWYLPTEPLTQSMLPTRAQLTTPGPVGAARVTLFCRRYDVKSAEGQRLYDADPFLGIRWSCAGGRCVPEVGYPLPKNLAVSPGRLRLCVKESEKAWKEKGVGFRPCYDVAPAFADRGKALALAGELLADARRTLTDACRGPDTCSPRSRTLTDACRGPDTCSPRSRTVMAILRPARWRPTTFSGTPEGLRLTAETDDRKLSLDCRGQPNRDARCNLTLRDGAGRELLAYAPIPLFDDPADAILDLAGQGHVYLTAAPGELRLKPDSACTVSGDLLDVR